jgi:hypothetical protein
MVSVEESRYFFQWGKRQALWLHSTEQQDHLSLINGTSLSIAIKRSLVTNKIQQTSGPLECYKLVTSGLSRHDQIGSETIAFHKRRWLLQIQNSHNSHLQIQDSTVRAGPVTFPSAPKNILQLQGSQLTNLEKIQTSATSDAFWENFLQNYKLDKLNCFD